MLNLNKTKRNIAVILALVMVFAMCLVGCTDQQARDDAQAAKDAAAAAVTTQQLTKAIEDALAGIKTGVSADEVTASINAALENYAKKSELPTDVVNNKAVEDAIKKALENYKTSADTDAAIKAVSDILDPVKKNVDTLVSMKNDLTTSADLLQKRVEALETAIAELQVKIDGKANSSDLDGLKDLANSKIDIDKWNAATGDAKNGKGEYVEGVIKYCLEVDHLEQTCISNSVNYTKARYDEYMDICYAAKIKLYRSVDEAACKEIYEWAIDETNKVHDIYDDAEEVEKLIKEIAGVFSVTTEDKEVVKAADAAYKKLLADYGVSENPEYLTTKWEITLSLDLLNYGLEKLANVTAESERLNEEVKKFLDKYETFENIAVDDYDKIVKLQGEIEEFIADHTNDIAENLEKLGKKVTELDKGQLFDVDCYNTKKNNNGVNTIAGYDKFEELCDAVWYNKFEDLKNAAMVAVTSKWGALVEGMTKDSSEYKAIAKVGTAFTKVMDEVLTWDLYTEKGATNPARLNAAEVHLEKIRTYLKSDPENQDDDVTIEGGFNYYLDQVKAGTAITEPETLAETIIRELLAVTKVQASGEGFDNYKPIVINEFAKAVKQFTEGKDLTADQTNTVNDIFMSYAKYVLNMKYEDYTYSKIDAEYKKQVAEHFDAIIAKFAEVIGEVANKTGDDVLAYGAVQCKTETIDGIVKGLVPAIKTTTK